MPAASTGDELTADPGAILLQLMAADGRLPEGAAANLPPLAWERIDGIARQHRLQPLLHHRTRHRRDIPASILDGWSEARRGGAAIALVQLAELRATIALLESADLHPVALKGAWLAWHIYPEPALRPLRDIDLLLPPTEAVAAYDLLASHGYSVEEATELSLEDSLRLDKHLPPLVSPRGVPVELHHRLWEIDGRMDHSAPAADECAFRDRCVRTGGILFPSPQDMLVHLIVHAAYDHRLDCGGLVLSDIAGLLHAFRIDWDLFWKDAGAQGYERGARTLLAMVERLYDSSVTICWPKGQSGVPRPVLAAAGRLLFQDLATRQSAGIYATATAGGWAKLLRRLRARRASAQESGTTARDLAGEGGYGMWALDRLKRTATDMSRRRVLEQGRDLAVMSRWLDRGVI